MALYHYLKRLAPSTGPTLCLLLVLTHIPGQSCNGILIEWVPTSQQCLEGESTTFKCSYTSSLESVTVTWKKIQSSNNGSLVTIVTTCGPPEGRFHCQQESDSANLTISSVEKNDSGIYICKVSAEGLSRSSCGTYLRIVKPLPTALLNMEEGTKNTIITAEGIILLICAVVPGTILLFQKRWENEKNFQTKKGLDEGENLYEGLNLSECSMYEDITRGLQSTYQDVAIVRVPTIPLEKP